MDYLYIVIVSILIVSALMIVLLTNTKNSNNIILQGNKLTIFHPLKREDNKSQVNGTDCIRETLQEK